MSDAEDAPRVAVVTGGARGIGRAISLSLAAAGFRVVVNYNASEDAARALEAETSGCAAPAVRFRADVANVEEVRGMFNFVRRELGRLDVLVNNAGILSEEVFAMTSTEQFWRVMQVNLGGVVNCCKSAVPLFARRRAGRIVNLSSIAAFHAGAGLSAYSSSKAAVIALSATLARELASIHVAVNVVAPGLVETEMTAAMRSPESRARALAVQPVQRIGTAEEVAAVVRFLAVEAPAYLTGEVIRVDGGAMIGA